MQVFLNKDIARIGLAGEIIKVSDGFARNCLIPQGLAVEITEANKKQYQARIRIVEHRKEVIATETSVFAEKINTMHITLKHKMSDDGKLYGAISGTEIVDALAEKGITIGKSQVKFDKAIKSKGTHKVTIQLTSRLKPVLTVTVASE